LRRISALPATANRAAVVLYRRRRTLWAEQGTVRRPHWLRLTKGSADAIGRASAGYVGDSDGWQDFARNGAMTWEYENAGPGKRCSDRRASAPRRASRSGLGAAPNRRRRWPSAVCCSLSIGASGRSPAKTLSMIRRRARVSWKTPRMAVLDGSVVAIDRFWVVAVRASGGVAEPQRARVLMALSRRTRSAVIARRPVGNGS